jgi:hypothetical protein
MRLTSNMELISEKLELEGNPGNIGIATEIGGVQQ